MTGHGRETAGAGRREATDSETRVLVTGAAGFIGSHLARDLVADGHRVVGIDNLVGGDRDRIDDILGSDSFTFRERDVRDGAVVRDAVAGVDRVYHQAALTNAVGSLTDPVGTSRTNCTGTAHLLEAAREHDVERVVVASSAAVYGPEPPVPTPEAAAIDPATPYATSKYWTERLACQLSAIDAVDAVALRYFNVYGAGQDPEGDYAAVVPAFLERMRSGKPPVVYGDGEQSRDFVHVDDVVRANRLAMTGDATGEAFNVGTGRSTTINDLAAELNAVLDTSLAPEYEDARPGDARHSRADISKARSQLGYAPRVDLATGLARTVAADGGPIDAA